MLNKENFIKIIHRLQETDNLQKKVNKIFEESTDSEISDGMNAANLMISHEDLVVELLQNIFNGTDMISYWLYELDYGKKYKKGYVKDSDGKIVDISTPEKLYDYLVGIK